MSALPSLVKRFAPLVLIAGFLAGSYGVQKRMNELRVAYRLTDTDIAENAPPLVAFTTVALGSFRGVAADMLWLYSQRMQDEGNYFEMYQLASWIVKLQPRFTGATAYLAWNMAYNISVTFSGFDERWRWVQRGIELIRDEALLYNPGDPELYKELGWIYQHKVGQELDDANRYYKLMLAREMTMVLGGYPVDWAEMADSPDTVPALDKRLLGGADLESLLAASRSDLRALEKTFRSNGGKLPEAVAGHLEETGNLDLVKRFLHVRWLKQRLKLDPQRLHRLSEKYGDLDWRLPEAHAVYWATLGLNTDNDMVNVACERMIFQSLSNAFRGGRIAYMGSLETLEITPNVKVVDAVNQQYLDSIGQHGDNSSFLSGYRNWLIDAIVTLHIFGDEKKAADYQRKLLEVSTDPRHRRPLDTFVLDELAGDVTTATFDQAHAIVQGMIYQGMKALAIGDDDRAAAFDRLAAKVWDRYMKEIGSGRSGERRKLPDLKEMRTTMFARRREMLPADLAANLDAAMARRREQP